MPTVQAVLWHTILLLAYIHDEQHHLPGPAGFIFRTRTYSAAAANEQGVSSMGSLLDMGGICVFPDWMIHRWHRGDCSTILFEGGDGMRRRLA